MEESSFNKSAAPEEQALLARIKETLPRLDTMLLEERKQKASIPESPREQWDLFRALVNTRPPEPTPKGFLELQDQLLQDILSYRGIVTPDKIPSIPGHPHLKLWQGDITTLAVDAIVNAANSQLLGCFIPGHFCIDNAIHTFAGVQLRLECATVMEEQGYPEPTGMAKATPAFNLPSTYVIHTVGPIAGGSASTSDRALLANCYTSCLDAAAALGCESIAFCCISTGVFGFPQAEAARIAISTVTEWLEAHQRKLEVIFNVFSDKDLHIYQDLLFPSAE